MRKQKQESESTTFTFRLTQKELTDLEQVAKQTGQSVSEYLRHTIKLRPVRSILTQPQIGIMVSIPPYFNFNTLHTWNENVAFIERRDISCTGIIMM